MNMAAATLQYSSDLLTALAVFVRVGLTEFRTLKQLDTAAPGEAMSATDINALLRQSVLDLTGEARPPSWFDAQQKVVRALKYTPEQHPLKRLHDDYALSPAQLFVLGLLGEMETSHIANLVVAELQMPERVARPRLHLVLALLETLFPVAEFTSGSIGLGLSIFSLMEQPLVRDQLLVVTGDEPLPLRQLQISPHVWSLLSGRAGLWPGCHAVVADDRQALPAALTQQLPTVVKLMGGNPLDRAPLSHAPLSRAHHVSGLTLRSLPNRGSQDFAFVLAEQLEMVAVNIPVDLWRDQPALRAMARYAKWLPVLSPTLGPGDVLVLPRLEKPHPLLILLGTDGALDAEGFLELQLELPTQDEREACWVHHIAQPELAQRLAASALLGAVAIRQIARHAQQLAYLAGGDMDLATVAKARRLLDAEKLRLLAQPVERDVSAEQLIMPPLVEQGLDLVVKRAMQRESLWLQLGKTAQTTRSSGVRTLFVGESGTGKTLAASYIATQLGAPLYRVDLSAVMNKYIGESEKNLSQLLDYAAANDVVLLFDEADALFGARTEGKETGERFANMLTNFLLTRLENHPGIVVLTTNNRQRIDSAFSRRIDTVVEFPLPGFAERLSLWHSHLGESGPGEAVYRHLASYCDLAGGQVRNAVLTAAVHAAGKPVSEGNLVAGLEAEYQKSGRSLPGKIQQLIAR